MVCDICGAHFEFGPCGEASCLCTEYFQEQADDEDDGVEYTLWS